MKQATYWAVKLTAETGPLCWERIFTTKPTVKEIIGALTYELNTCTPNVHAGQINRLNMLLEVIGRVDPDAIAPHPLRVKVAGTTIGWLEISQSKVYT